VTQRGLEFVALEAGAVIDFDPGGGEQFDSGGFELIGDQYARHFVLGVGCWVPRTLYSERAPRL
jgi:hypothetical protein